MAVHLIPLSALPAAAEQSRAWCAQLEAGAILCFPQTPVAISRSDLDFLLSLQQADSRLHKNIAYKPASDRLSGLDRSASRERIDRLHDIMRRYSAAVAAFLSDFLAPYQLRWQLDYASYRPVEEAGRDLPTRSRNDLLHTDAFPTRPTRGARILRFFHNIHPTRTRDWIVAAPFPCVVGHFLRPARGTGPTTEGWENIGLEERSVRRGNQQGTGLKGTGLEGTGLEGTGVEGTGLKGTGLKGTGLEGTGLEGTGVEGTGLEGTGVEGTGLKGTGFSPYIHPLPIRGALAPEATTPHPLPLPRPDSLVARAARTAACAAGLAALIPSLKRTPYDEFMMRLHNTMKEDAEFQRACPREAVQFPPGSSWMVYTETVPHAVLSGQYALEQTFLVDPAAMVTPRSAPVAILEKMAGARLV